MSIAYEDIKQANDAIRTTNIKGKEYAEVNQRIKAFRMVYPTATIETEILSIENGMCIFKATVRDGSNILGTGHAYEKEGSSFINETSHIENCETSAVGRALGMAGFGIDTSVASAEEVQNAMTRKASSKQVNILGKVYKGENLTKLLEANGISRLEDISAQKASDLISKLQNRQ